MIYSALSCDELVRACAEGNAEAWEEFVRRFTSVISTAIWRVMRRHGEYDPALNQDLIQDTFFKLCDDNFRVLRNFKPQYEDAIYGMTGKVAANIARDHYRKRPLPVIDCDVSEVTDFIPDRHAPDSDHLEFRRLCQQVDQILRAHCTARDREIFWLYYGENGLTASEIAKISRFKLNEKGVESVLHRLKCLVRRKLAERQENGEGPDKAA